MSVSRLNVLLAFACFWIALSSNPVKSADASNPSCSPIKQLLTDWIVTFSISYFADNPKNDQQPLNPESVVPYTPSGLFQAYYGKEASAWEFQSAILDIVYAAYVPPPKGERVQLRKQLYTLAKAGSSETARKVMGSILSDVISEYNGDSEMWDEHHCISNANVNNIWKATSVEFARLRNEVGDLMFGRFLEMGLGTTLAFVIDDTGSMGGEIDAAKRRVNVIIDHVQNTLDRPKDFVLVPFNDPKVGPLTVTTDAKVFKSALARLHAHGGGDSPEMCMGGLKLAVEASRPGSTIYVITDAAAKDFKLQDTVVAEAKRKSITVIFMLTNDFRGCWAQKDPRYKKCFNLYEYVANETGGSIFVVRKSDIFKATEIVQSSIRQGAVVISQQKITERNGQIRFPVDRSLSAVEIESKGSCGAMSVTKSNGRASVISQNLAIVLVTIPVNKTYGNWTLTASGDKTNCEVKITARSTFGFILTTFLKKSSAEGNAYQLLKGNPSPRDPLRFVLDPYGTTGNQNFKIRLIDENGNDVIPPTSNSLVVETNGPLGDVQPFRVVVEGGDSQKGKFRRVVSSQIKPSSVTVTCDFRNIIFRPGIATDVNVTVRNHGRRERFVFTSTDKKNFASVLHPLSATINQSETKRFTLRLLAPENTKDGVASAVTVSARGSSTDSLQYDVCEAVVGLKKRPRIDALRIKGTINSRFAETVVTSVVTNNADVGREAEFDVMLPVEAFITGLTMRLDNETIVGRVEEKQKAKKIYTKAKKRGKAAGHVAARDSSTRVFKTSMFVEPRKVITFELVYQELLKRDKGRYRYKVVLNPAQPVKSLRVDVFIEEKVALQFVTVPPFKTDQANKLGESSPQGTRIKMGRHRKSAHVNYNPTIDLQTQYSPLGLSGTFEVQYDLQRSAMYGDITHANGYFAHFFAPPALPVIPKIVVFMIDISGSMLGYKIEQVREALTASLRSLQEHDYFNIVFVNHEARPWINMIISPADSVSVDDAIKTINEIQPNGGTNILQGFQKAFQLMRPYFELTDDEDFSASGDDDTEFSGDALDTSQHYKRVRRTASVTRGTKDNYEKIIVFLSDGKASSGETDPTRIVEAVGEMNQDRVRINTLGFGPLANMKMLREIAGFNGGSSRRVFEELDASQQISGFFDDVTNLLLTDISMVYPADRVKDVTKYEFETFPSGTELVVAGRFRRDAELVLRDGLLDPISAQVRGKTFDNNLELDFDVDLSTSSTSIMSSQHQISNFTQKLWAFMRVKDLISKATLEQNNTASELIKSEALDMSLKYSLVTPYTSLVVVKPDERKEIEEELIREEKERKKAEEKKRKLEVEKAKLKDEELLRGPPPAAITEDLMLYDYSLRKSSDPAGRSSSSKLKGGFYGDPHFLIPLRPDLFICFDWDGEDGQVYNLIHDDVTGLTVNGRLVTSPAPERSKKSHRSYISHLAIIIPNQKFKILISPFEITILPVGASEYTVPVTSSMTFSRRGVTMKAYDVERRSARIVVVVNGIEFNVIQRRTFGHPYQADHVDFNVNDYDIPASAQINGVIGQFLNKNAKLLPGHDENERILKINGRSGHVTKFERQQPGSHDKVTCWNSRHNAQSIIAGRRDNYVVDDIMATPSFSL